MNEMRSPALTVEQLNTYIKDYLGTSPLLGGVCVKGEISNARVYGGSGHIYFTLKDENSSLSCTMFGGMGKIKFKPENGMKVVCTGRVAVFVRDGQYRLYADTMEPDGIGALYIAFEQLKEKLRAQGLFAPEHKKKIPKIPFSVGIITAPGGAAVRDMINVARRRFPAAKLCLYPSLVQGPNAPKQLINALKELDESKTCDVIIIGRGGGSAEDLWCFNDEGLAYAVYACETPVISAVGHETDFTICDFVADLRAPTPSAAAELAVPDVRELKKQFANVEKRMLSLVSSFTSHLKQRLLLLSSRPVLQSPENYFLERKMALSRNEEKLYSCVFSRLEREKMRLYAKNEKLSGLNPLAILERGFSVAFDSEGNIIKSKEKLPCGTEFNLKLSDGDIKAVSEQNKV